MLWAGGEFSLYQGRQSGNAVSVLMLAPASGQQTSASPRWLEHEYALATKLDPAWPRSHAHSLNMKAARIAMGALACEPTSHQESYDDSNSCACLRPLVD
jgi:hypothetical protein